jgi:hypothetical protein
MTFDFSADSRFWRCVARLAGIAELASPVRDQEVIHQPDGQKPMRRIAAVIRPLICTALLAGAPFSAASATTAKPLDQNAWLMRMMSCEGEGVSMELYLPQSVIFANRIGPDASGMQGGQTVIGYYTLDLTDANKGKSLEPVRITLSADRKTVTVDQYTRGLPPTRIPVKGGTVDFDQRFGSGAKCGPFQSQDPDYGNKR